MAGVLRHKWGTHKGHFEENKHKICACPLLKLTLPTCGNLLDLKELLGAWFHTGQYEMIWDDMGRYGTIWEHTGAYKMIQNHIGQYKTIQNHRGRYWMIKKIQDHMV